MRPIVFYTSSDRAGRRDASGAFIPEAMAFRDLWQVPTGDMVPVPQSIPAGERRALVRRELRWRAERVNGGHPRHDAFVYFGHGTSASLPGIGYGRASLPELARLLTAILDPRGRVALYGCLAGKGRGIADELDAALPEAIRTVAHLTAGHASWNPHTEYSGEGPTRSGVPIIAPGDPLWRVWLARLRADQRFRLTFPWMSETEIRAALDEEDVPPGPSRRLEEMR